MTRQAVVLILLSGLSGLAALAPALSAPADWTLSSGFGEEISVKQGWFGRREKVVKDRLGDQFIEKKGLFGSKTTEINLLGNKLKKKKSWFGQSQWEGSTILGDSVTSKKGLFGRRKTEVDLSGVASALKALVGPRASTSAGSEPGDRDVVKRPSLADDAEGLRDSGP